MRTFRLVLLPLMAAGLATAQDSSAVESAERQFADCVVKKDTACLTELTGDSFVMHQSVEGRPLTPVTKALFLKGIPNLAMTFYSIDEIKVAASSSGDAAVATMRVRMISEGRGMTGSFLVTDIWTKNGGQWKLAMRNAGRSEKMSY